VPKAETSLTFKQKLYEARHLIPVVLLIASVVASIYSGIATATEAAAIGVAGALVLSASQKALTWDSFKASLFGATRLYCMIALILAGAAFMTLSMGYIGLPRQLAEFVGSLQLSPAMLIIALGIFYILIGCFLDGISTIVLTMSVVLPIIQAAGIDPLWFGIFLVITVETAQITPPVGFNLFVLQSMTGKQITYIAKVCAPYFLLMVLALVILWFFPSIVTALPAQM
jgi:tripartite ATP-independent transporter DctM subunit